MSLQGAGIIVRLALAAGCLVMGALTLLGVFSGARGNERWVLGVGWTVAGAGWLFRCYRGRLSRDRSADHSENSPDDESR